MVKIRWFPYRLIFKYPFTLSSGQRNGTDAVYVEVESDGMTGYGEAAMPPYVRESQESVAAFLGRFNPELIQPGDLTDTFNKIHALPDGDFSARAALDIALHDLYCKMNRCSVSDYYKISHHPLPSTSFTISIDDERLMHRKINESSEFNIYKLKLGGSSDKDAIDTFKTLTGKPFCADVNQGWKDKHFALEMTNILSENGCLFIEQPMPKDNPDDAAWLTARSPIPVIADEAVQRIGDIDRLAGSYTGINIKLMKCGGIREAFAMIQKAREKGLKILVGCMSESSCAVTAAAHLSRLADWADLDGPYLISNDPFDGMKVADGKIVLPHRFGTGAVPTSLFSASAQSSSSL